MHRPQVPLGALPDKRIRSLIQFGTYRYTVTLRYFANATMTSRRLARRVLDIDVEPFVRAVSKSRSPRVHRVEAFVRHFGIKRRSSRRTPICSLTPRNRAPTTIGEQFTFAQEYDWLGFTARKCILDLLQKLVDDSTSFPRRVRLRPGEPDAKERLYNWEPRPGTHHPRHAAPHCNMGTPSEDLFQLAFVEQAGAGAIKRGKFGRYADDKVFIVSDATGPKTAPTGSTNFW